MITTDEIEQLEKRLRTLNEERTAILSHLEVLRSRQVRTDRCIFIGTKVAEEGPATAEDKIALFLTLFRCRESLYPKLWENHRKGIKGYSPACRNEWVRGICRKSKTKCSECPNNDFLPLDEQAVQNHLQGLHTIGTYAIRENNSCAFLACDFDEDGWQKDACTYQAVAESYGIQVCIERSRSGEGAHAWIFFSEPVPARLARMLGTALLTKAGDDNPTTSLRSYDRFFPNQDYLPKGGFGNLIALPLQRVPRDNGNSVFIDCNLQPYPDQWKYLASIKRISFTELRKVLDMLVPQSKLVKAAREQDISYIIDESILTITQQTPSKCKVSDTVEIALSSQITIPTAGLPSPLITKLKRTATFPNPRFYELQRMRMSTYPHPRFIFSGELRPESLILPRGLLDKVKNILRKAGASVIIRDKRRKFRHFNINFHGELTSDQKEAVDGIKDHKIGVLVAPPGAGKTVMACALIAHRTVPTLILVHRQPLIGQWKDHIHTFLEQKRTEIGEISGRRKKCSGKIDIAMLQTLSRAQDLLEIVRKYGLVVIDECHHIPAATFEGIMKEIPARYIYGLTATPYRKDRLEKILFQQCGPIRFEIKPGIGLPKRVIVRKTGFRLPDEIAMRPPYHVLIELLTKDITRQDFIVTDAVAAIRKGRFPLIIADRKELLQNLETKISEDIGRFVTDLKIIRMDGALSLKKRKAALAEIHNSLANHTPVCLLATASLLGEGFDLPELDTLILASPLSFKGRLIQYAGRIHRLTEKKGSVLIHDYLDYNCAITLKMYKNRLKAYKEMGYQVEMLADTS